jgi:hypothetical protein
MKTRTTQSHRRERRSKAFLPKSSCVFTPVRTFVRVVMDGVVEDIELDNGIVMSFMRPVPQTLALSSDLEAATHKL